MRVGLETEAVQMFLNENSQLKAEEGFRHSSNLFLWGKATKREGSGLQIGFGGDLRCTEAKVLACKWV